MKPKTRFAAAAMLSAMSAACATQQSTPAPTVTHSALCLIDRIIPYRMHQLGDDLGNRWDTPETIDEIDRHNDRLMAACGR